MDKLEIGTRIRITKVPKENYEYYSVGDEAVVQWYNRYGYMWCEFDRKYGDGVWCVGEIEETEFEVVDTGELTHAEYFRKYGTLTEARIRDVLAVYEKDRAAKDLMRRVREIDEAAARYLEKHGKGAVRLLDAFTWTSTPQGDTYWRNIARQLGEVA